MHQTTSKITIKPLNQDDWQSKTLKCKCVNEITELQSLSIDDSKSISVNCKKKLKINIFAPYNFNFYQKFYFQDAPILKIIKITNEDLIPGNYIQFECSSDSKPPITNFKLIL